MMPSQNTFVPDFIKGAGGERRCAAHARFLAERKPSLIVEVHARDIEDECIDLLNGHGYAPLVVDQTISRTEDRPLEHNRWLVCNGRP